MKQLKTFALALSAAALIGAPASAQVTVGTPDPVINNCFPIGCNLGYPRAQEVFNANAFSGPIDIASFTWFTPSADGTQHYADGTYTVSFGITSRDPYSMSTNPSAQADVSPLAFFATFVLSNTTVETTFNATGTPYLYDPSKGNLVMDVVTDQTGPQFDWAHMVYSDADYTCADGPGDHQTGVLYGPGGGAVTNCAGGLVTQFNPVPGTETTAPEPASLILVATGLFGVVGFSRRRAAA